ncbi:hypothetical protein BWZ20_02755 [Winogradskyella sp. J14-2]|nr:hypothetical protein BWZ20_02755 [Winogradskyella sp. J14-2]
MKKFLTIKSLKIFLAYSLVFSIVIYFVHGNNDYLGSILFGFILGIALFAIHASFNETKEDSNR